MSSTGFVLAWFAGRGRRHFIVFHGIFFNKLRPLRKKINSLLEQRCSHIHSLPFYSKNVNNNQSHYHYYYVDSSGSAYSDVISP